MKFFLILVMISYICTTTDRTRQIFDLLDSDCEPNYKEKSIPKDTPKTEYSEYNAEEYESEETDEIDTSEVEYYMKKLARDGPSTKSAIETISPPTIKEKTKKPTKSKKSTIPKTTHIYFIRNISSRRTYTRRKTTKLSRFKTTHVRRKRALGDSYDHIEKYTRIDSMEKELLFSGKYAPWQRRLYAFRKFFSDNKSAIMPAQRSLKFGKKRLQRYRHRKDGVIHQKGYRIRKRQNLSSIELSSNSTDFVHGLPINHTRAGDWKWRCQSFRKRLIDYGEEFQIIGSENITAAPLLKTKTPYRRVRVEQTKDDEETANSDEPEESEESANSDESEENEETENSVEPEDEITDEVIDITGSQDDDDDKRES